MLLHTYLTFNPETGVGTHIATLIGIITEVITAGNLTGLDAKVNQHNIIC